MKTNEDMTIDPYDSWLSSPHCDYEDDDEEEVVEDFDFEEQEPENPSYMDSDYYDGTGS